MSKLKLEHLAPYLPYNLKFFFKDFREGQLRIKPDGSILEMNIYNLSYIDFDVERKFTEFKPILRPLSDLIKEIEINGKKFVPYYWFEKYKYSCYLGFEKVCIRENHYNVFVINENSYDEKQMLNLPLRIVNKLLEWHFDVFGLIDKGLAININTLSNE